MSARDRYQANLMNPRPPGTGCHGWIMSTANLAVMAGLTGEQVFQDIRLSIPPGKRRISDREIYDAICKAITDHQGGTFTPRPHPKPIFQDGKAVLQRIIEQGEISDDADLWDASPIRLSEEPQKDMILLFETLYRPDDIITIRSPIQAGIIGQTIRPVSDWLHYFNKDGPTAEHIIPAPVTGQQGLTKTGAPSFQCDNTVKTPYRYCVVEFDDLSRNDQIRFWSAVRLPVVCLIDSGGKSIHAWLDVQKLAKVETLAEWEAHIKASLYGRILTPMGVDSSCSNPSRLSRLPGHFREAKKAWQRLLWLSQEGRTICQ